MAILRRTVCIIRAQNKFWLYKEIKTLMRGDPNDPIAIDADIEGHGNDKAHEKDDAATHSK